MAAEALEQSVLESKDKDQLLAIAKALGVKASTRTKKSDIIDQILETTGASRGSNGDAAPTAATLNGNGANGDGAVAVLEIADVAVPVPTEDLDATPPAPEAPPADEPAITEAAPVLGEDGEPLAEWELALGGDARDRRRR